MTQIVYYSDSRKNPHPPLWNYGYIRYHLDDLDFKVEKFQSEKIYSDDTIFYIPAKEYNRNTYPSWFHDYRCIIDVKGESLSGRWGGLYSQDPTKLFLYGCKEKDSWDNVIYWPEFFWCDSAWSWLINGTHNYNPDKTYTNTFLMPVRNYKDQAAWRGDVIEELRDLLPSSIYSIYAENIFLPGSNKDSDVREINYSWFNDTYFSLTLESYIDPIKPIFLTEKIFKPIGFFHPFLLLGSPYSLITLREWGFVTFDNIFDESYDVIDNLEDKISIIKNNIENYTYEPYTTETWNRLKHNHNLFFDRKRILDLAVEKCLIPLKTWCEQSS